MDGRFCIRAGLVVGAACLPSLGCASAATLDDTVGQSRVEVSVPALAGKAPFPSTVNPIDTPRSDDVTTTDQPAAVGASLRRAAARPFSLTIDLDEEPHFRVFAESDLGVAEAPALQVGGSSPGTSASIAADLAFSTDLNRIPPGLRLSFKPVTWADLDGWERTGLVLSVASSVVGAGYLLYALFH